MVAATTVPACGDPTTVRISGGYSASNSVDPPPQSDPILVTGSGSAILPYKKTNLPHPNASAEISGQGSFRVATVDDYVANSFHLKALAAVEAHSDPGGGGGAYAYASVTVEVTGRVQVRLDVPPNADDLLEAYIKIYVDGNVTGSPPRNCPQPRGAIGLGFDLGQLLFRYYDLRDKFFTGRNFPESYVIELTWPLHWGEILDLRVTLEANAGPISLGSSQDARGDVRADYSHSMYWGGVTGVRNVTTGTSIPISEFHLIDEDGTDWAHPPPVIPKLLIEPSGADAALSWPKWATSEFSLETATDLVLGNWINTTVPYQTNGSTVTVTWPIIAAETARFFRLHRP